MNLIPTAIVNNEILNKVMNKPSIIILENGEILKVSLFRIESRYEDGTPENLTLIKENMTVELSNDPEKNYFLIAYVNEKMLKG